MPSELRSTEFHFDESSHTYTVNGKPVISCTQILLSGGLVSFDFVSRDILERKSELGREVHKACHLHNQKKEFTCDRQVEGYLHSWVEWCAQMRFTPRLSEHQQIAYINNMDFAMQIDAEGALGAQDVIVDYKIGDIMPHHAIQLAGYAAGLYHSRLETPLGRFRSRKRIVVKLQENGTLAKIHRFEDKSDFDVFASALFVTFWKKKFDSFYREQTP